ncbi:MAG: glycosyltransferase 61 family protein, partial [Pseudomonadota bacterium]
FFGHWLREACSTAVLAPEGVALILDVPEAGPHARAYVEGFGLSPTAGRPLRVERLTVYTDNSYGSHRVARMRTLRARLGTGARGGGGRLYLERGAAGSPRGLADTAGFHAALQRLGFQILDITAARYQEVAAAIAAADLVLAIEGSHQSHIHYHLRERGALLTLMPADRLSTIHTACALALGFRYGYVVIDPTPDGYGVDLGDLEATLALLDA